MWEDLGKYISNYCNNNNNNLDDKILDNAISKTDYFTCKVVEIAIGKFFSVANYFNNDNNNCDSKSIDFTATDINPANSDIVFDDVTKPNMEIYDNSDIIYSIRPPQELQPYIADIVSKTGAILIIKPLFNEDLNLNLPMKLVNYKKAVFYQSM